MTNDPDQIRANIERTRAELSNDVDALGEKVAPGQVIRRRTERTRRFLGTARERVMGAPAQRASEMRGEVSATADRVSSTASDAASAVRDAATEAPRVARERIEGNPLAAGLIAFGLGWLVSSMLPPSRQERRLAAQAKDEFGQRAQPMVEEAKGAAQDVAERMREPARQAAESVKETAKEAAGTAKEETRSAAQEAKLPPPHG